MNFIRSKRAKSHYPIEDDRPAKRISTPAGQRLSIVLEAKRGKSPSAAGAAKISVTTESTFCNDPSHQHVGPVQHGHAHRSEKKGGLISVLTGGRLNTPRESSEDGPHNGSNLSVSVWSDRDEEKFGHVRQQRQRRGFGAWGWKRIAVVAAIIIALIVALGVGLAMGLKKDSKRYVNMFHHLPRHIGLTTYIAARPQLRQVARRPQAAIANPTPTPTLPPQLTLLQLRPPRPPPPLSLRTSPSALGRSFCSSILSQPVVPQTPIPGHARQTQTTTMTHKRLSQYSTGTLADHQGPTRYHPVHRTTRSTQPSRMRTLSC